MNGSLVAVGAWIQIGGSVAWATFVIHDSGGPSPVALLLCFPLLLALGMLAFARLTNHRFLVLLERGLVTDARLVEQKKIPLGLRPRHVLTFELEDRRGQRHRVVSTTFDPAVFPEGAARVVYDLEDPRRAALLKDIPGAPHELPGGGLRDDDSRLGRATSLALPAIVTLGSVVSIVRAIIG
jgi:hypothetical protein